MELRTVYDMFTDCWKLYKEYSQTDLSDEDIDRFISATERLSKKYSNTFANEVALAVLNEINRLHEIKSNSKDVSI